MLMRFNKISFVFILIVYLGVSCCDKKTGDTVSSILSNPDIEVIDIDHADLCEKMLFSSFFDTPKVVILETNENCIISNIQSIDFYDGKFYILDDISNALYVFADDGSYIQNIGHQGNGHGEYIEISDFSIDRQKEELYLWDEAMDVALKYNIKTGDYISSVRTERNGERSFCMQYNNGHLFVNRTSINDDGEQYLLKEIDTKNGKQIAAYLNAKDYNKGWNYPLRFPFTFFYAKNSESPKYVEMFSDTIVSITSDGIIPSYVIKSNDFISKEDVSQLIKSQKTPLDFNMEALHKMQRISHISRYADFKDAVYLEYEKGENHYYLIYNEKDKKTIISSSFVNDYISKDLNIPMKVCYSDKSGVLVYIMSNHVPYFVKHIVQEGLLEKNVDNYEQLRQLKEDSNPILFYHKYRR
jgi:hypothetical protein